MMILWCLFLLLFSSQAFAQVAIPHMLTWTDNSSGRSQEDRFEIERKEGAWSYVALGTTATDVATYQDTQLLGGLLYTYRVRACNIIGCSGYSNEASKIAVAGQPPTAPGTPTITWIAAAPSLIASYHFDEGSGTTTADASGNGNTGTLNGATWITTGKYGGALSFDGVNDWVTVNDANSLDLTTGMTLEAWVYPTAASGGWRDVIYKVNDMYYLEGSSTNGGVPATGGTFSTSGPLYGTATLPLNTWSHLAATYDGATMRLFINGVEVASRAQTGSIQISTGALSIGGDAFYGQYWVGRIDEVRIYSRPLSASEIQGDMEAALP